MTPPDTRLVLSIRLAIVARGFFTFGSQFLTTLLLLEAVRVSPRTPAICFVAIALSAILASGFSGVAADGASTRVVLICSGVVAACAATLALFSDGFAMRAAWSVAGITVLGFSSPSVSGMVARHTPLDSVAKYVSAQQLAMSVAGPAGAAAAGVGYGAVGLHAYSLGIGVAVAGAMISAPIRAPRSVTDSAHLRFRPRSFDESIIRTIWRDPVLRHAIALQLVILIVLGAVTSVEVVLARSIIGMSAAAFGINELFGLLGSLVVVYVAGRLAGPGTRVVVIPLAAVLAGAAVVALGAATNTWQYWVLTTVIVGLFAIPNLLISIMLATRVPNQQRGSAAAALAALSKIASLASYGFAILATSFTDVRAIVVGAGLITAAIALGSIPYLVKVGAIGRQNFERDSTTGSTL